MLELRPLSDGPLATSLRNSAHLGSSANSVDMPASPSVLPGNVPSSTKASVRTAPSSEPPHTPLRLAATGLLAELRTLSPERSNGRTLLIEASAKRRQAFTSEIIAYFNSLTNNARQMRSELNAGELEVETSLCRVAVRIVLACFWVALLVVLICKVLFLRPQATTHVFSAATPLRFDVKNCNITIAGGVPLTATVDMGACPGTVDRGPGNALKVRPKSRQRCLLRPSYCQITLTLPHSTSAVEIIASGNVNVSSTRETVSSFSQSFAIRGKDNDTHVRVLFFGRLEAPSLSFSAAAGHVHLGNFYLTATARHTGRLRIDLGQGNAIISSGLPVLRVGFTLRSKKQAYCFSGANVTSEYDECLDDAWTDNGNFTRTNSSGCYSRRLVCASDELCADSYESVSVPEATVSLSDGALYASVRTDASPSVESTIGPLDLDPDASATISGLRRWFEKQPGTNAVAYVDIYGLAEPLRWVWTNNLVYLQLEPVWLSVFSLTLLKPRSTGIVARITPSTCPFSWGTDINANANALGQISDFLHSRIGTVPTDVVALRTADGARRTFERTASGTYVVHDVSLWQNTSLVLGVACSFLLALAFALGAFYAALWMLRHFLEQWNTCTAHSKRVAEVERSAEEVAAPPLPVIAISPLPHSSNQNRLDSDADSPWTLSLFELPDRLLRLYWQNTAQSLRLFLLSEVEVGSSSNRFRTSEAVPLRDFVERYEAFCRSKDYYPLPVRDQFDLLEGHGIRVHQRSDRSTEVFVGMRPKAKKELQHTDLRRLQSVSNSLMRMTAERYVVTRLPSDFVDLTEFAEAYSQYCEEKQLAQRAIHRDSFSHLGVTVERKVMTFLYPVSFRTTAVAKRPQSTRTWRAAVLRIVMYETLATLVHVITVIAVPLPVVCLAVWVQFFEAVTARGPYVQATSRLLPETLALFCCVVAFACIAIFELLCHYADAYSQTGPSPESQQPRGATSTAAPKHSLARRFLRSLLSSLVAVFATVTAAYVGLVLVWAILGAIINPERILPWASAAGTLMWFCLSKSRSLLHDRQRVRESVLRLVQEKLAATMEAGMPLGSGHWLASLDAEIVERFVKGNFQQDVDFNEAMRFGVAGLLENNPYVESLQSFVSEHNLDTALLLQFVNGDPRALAEALATRFGLSVPLATAIIAVCREDIPALTAALAEMAQHLGLNADVTAAFLEILRPYRTREAAIKGLFVTLRKTHPRLAALPADLGGLLIRLVNGDTERALRALAAKPEILSWIGRLADPTHREYFEF